jgi:hypothetical protein
MVLREGFLDSGITSAKTAQKTQSAIDNLALISGPAPVTKAPAPTQTSIDSAIANMYKIYGGEPTLSAPTTTAAAPASTPTTVAAADPVQADAPAEVAAPTTTETAVDDYQQSALARFTAADIEAALAAIEAEFGLTREQLIGDQTMIGAQYRLLTAQLARQQARALEGAEAGALQRGLFRSGIFAAEVGDIGQEFGEQQAKFAAEKQSKDLAITSRLATLGAEEAAAKATEEAAIRKGEYTARLAAAGL